MWRMTFLRLLIALNWSIAGIAFSFFVYSHHKLFSGNCFVVVKSQMEANGEKEDFDEVFRRTQQLQLKLKVTDNMGLFAWGMAMFGSAATAITLMIVFPSLERSAKNNRGNQQPSEFETT